MRRRDFLGVLGGGAAATWPLAARAQQPQMPVIGFLGLQSAATMAPQLAAFRAGLKEHGLIEDQNISIIFRWSGGRYEQLPKIADELVARQVALLITNANAAALAAKAATKSIPIVFSIGGDPVRLGLVTSLSHPGGNITGFSLFSDILIQKQLELLREIVPSASIVAALINVSNPDIARRRSDLTATAKALGMRLQFFEAGNNAEIDTAIANIARSLINAVLVQNDPFFNDQRARIIAAVANHKLATIYGERGYVAAGGLMAYGTDRPAVYRQVANYTFRILKGEKPAELPVQQPSKFVLAINLRTARQLGLTISPTLLARADEVIE